MLLDPGKWLVNVMELTRIPSEFKFFILLLALGSFLCAWIAEKHVLLWIARFFGKAHDIMWPDRQKVRKKYKIVIENMKI